MKTVCDINKCNGCMACIDICPKKCISINDTINANNAVINEEECINCKLCKSICPNITKVENFKVKEWYQGWAKNDIREKASSGGIASAIIKKIINNGGYVASCVFDKGEFIFNITNDLSEAKKFSGSKYVKSNPKGIYRKIEKILNDNKVLFIGLPCQVAALKNRIKNQTNLFTIDLICHGTPSPLLLKKYLQEQGFDINFINDIQFRNKTDYGISVNNIKITSPRILDEYTCAFIKGIDYTENCYSCEYASLNRVSDLTIGDSWGTELKDEEKKGISLILIQNEKGKDLLKDTGIILKNVNIENAILNNHQLSYPSKKTMNRDKFFKLLSNGKTFKYAICSVLPKVMIKQKMKYLLIKLNLI